jgi:hypothetical protein
MSDDDVAKSPTHHLMRVRVHSRIFHRLRIIAENECEVTGTYVSVSDLVRSALLNFLRTYESPGTVADRPAITENDPLSS